MSEFSPEQALEKLKEYIETYPDQMNWKEYDEKTFINDMLYGVGVAVDDSFQYADGFARFRKCIGRFGFDRELIAVPASQAPATTDNGEN